MWLCLPRRNRNCCWIQWLPGLVLVSCHIFNFSRFQQYQYFYIWKICWAFLNIIIIRNLKFRFCNAAFRRGFFNTTFWLFCVCTFFETVNLIISHLYHIRFSFTILKYVFVPQNCIWKSNKNMSMKDMNQSTILLFFSKRINCLRWFYFFYSSYNHLENHPIPNPCCR